MRSRTLSVLLAATAIAVSAPMSAQARMMFGKDETIHFIQDVKAAGPNKEPLYLGYMTAIQFFAAGLYVEDEGYVLGVKGDSKKFFHMPTGDQLRSLQQRGLLPDPLPPYSLNAFDYLFGYSLWIVLVVVGAWTAIDLQRKRKRREAASG
jgi:hypothetical protein